jgi:uncharacterized protein YukE
VVEPYVPVNYDFGAADRLAGALTLAATRVHALIEYRRSNRDSLLGDHPGERWSGQKRDMFDDTFVREQKAFMALEDELRLALKQLNRVTQQAHEANQRNKTHAGG